MGSSPPPVPALKMPKLPPPAPQQRNPSNKKTTPQSKSNSYSPDSFPYKRGSSMTGVFFLDSNGVPRFNFLRPYPYHPLPPPNFSPIPTPFTICSSTNGLLLVRDHANFRYHVINPFLPDAYRLIPDPPRFHKSICPSVLAIDRFFPQSNHFSINTAVLEFDSETDSTYGRYSFDRYTSDTNEWKTETDYLHLGRRIIPNSGVSNDHGMAFWLTELPHCVVKYDSHDEVLDFVFLIEIPRGIRPYIKVQIGRLGELGTGLVISTLSTVKVFVMRDSKVDEEYWEELAIMNLVDCNGDPKHEAKPQVYKHLAQNKVWCLQNDRPEVLRFETEVPIWIDGRILFWDLRFGSGSENEFYCDVLSAELHWMPWWEERPVTIGECVPYVHTLISPADFNVSGISET